MYIKYYINNNNVNVEDFQISKQVLCFGKTYIITTCDQNLVEKLVLYVDHMTILEEIWQVAVT